MCKYLCSLIFLFYTVLIFGQQKLNYSDQLIQEMATEVYNGCPQYITDGHLKLYKQELEKISIIKIERGNKDQKFLITNRLSSLHLKNKCNPNLKYDTGDSFDPKKFNALKYFFPINKDVKATYILVDDTHYVIRIER